MPAISKSPTARQRLLFAIGFNVLAWVAPAWSTNTTLNTQLSDVQLGVIAPAD